MLSSAVVDNDTVVGVDVECNVTKVNVEVVDNCSVLTSAVVVVTGVYCTILDCVAIGNNVVGFLAVAVAVVTAAVGDVADIAIGGEVATVMADLVVASYTVVTTNVVALVDVYGDVDADKVVEICVVEEVALDSHTYRYKDEHP